MAKLLNPGEIWHTLLDPLSYEASLVAIGVEICRLRTQRRISIKRFAPLAGIPENTLRRIERGKYIPPWYVVYNAERALGLPPGYFFRHEYQRRTIFLKREKARGDTTDSSGRREIFRGFRPNGASTDLIPIPLSTPGVRKTVARHPE